MCDCLFVISRLMRETFRIVEYELLRVAFARWPAMPVESLFDSQDTRLTNCLRLPYSVRRATNGSTVVLRRAGNKHDPMAMSTMNAAIPRIAQGL